ncbi:uncharacterized protein B0H18DRAFT_828123, partial [Fomitopsis serialis]|uniref:uncharacterized protein n=2 Tax=Fomitopsis serialis TaxID=139415 RepID=UPI0020072462
LMLVLRSELRDKDIPHRTKLRELIINRWKLFFEDVKKELLSAPGRINFTADIWSDQRRRGYLGVTAHWLA